MHVYLQQAHLEKEKLNQPTWPPFPNTPRFSELEAWISRYGIAEYLYNPLHFPPYLPYPPHLTTSKNSIPLHPLSPRSHSQSQSQSQSQPESEQISFLSHPSPRIPSFNSLLIRVYNMVALTKTPNSGCSVHFARCDGANAILETQNPKPDPTGPPTRGLAYGTPSGCLGSLWS